MRFGEIIKKAWHVTWRYRWLWVLGVFAGITGGSSGGSSGSTSYRQPFGSGSGTGSGARTGTANLPDWSSIEPVLQQWIPFIFLGLLVLFAIGIAFAVIGIGARGGLVWAVNEIEEGRPARLGDAWNAGFDRFWRVFGLGLVLQLPILLAVLLMMAAIFVPIFGPLLRGDSPNGVAVLAPMCGVLVIGVPVLIVASVVLGVMYITGLRFIILDGMETMRAAREGWRALRARFGDHALMYLISLGLNIAASLALVIPLVLVGLATMIPAGVAAAGDNWGLFAGMTALFVVLVFVLSLLFAGVWGTFTSAMWTIFFRRLTGREILAPAGYPVTPPPAAYAPPAPRAYTPSPDTPDLPVYTPPEPPMYAPPAPPVSPADEPPMYPPPAPPMYAPPAPPVSPADEPPMYAPPAPPGSPADEPPMYAPPAPPADTPPASPGSPRE